MLGVGRTGNWGLVFNGYGVSVRENGQFWAGMVVRDAQQCECTECQCARGVQTGTASLEDSIEAPQKLKTGVTI